jgi:hypothetical protein
VTVLPQVVESAENKRKLKEIEDKILHVLSTSQVRREHAGLAGQMVGLPAPGSHMCATVPAPAPADADTRESRAVLGGRVNLHFMMLCVTGQHPGGCDRDPDPVRGQGGQQ